MIPEQTTPVCGPTWEIIKRAGWPWRGWWVLKSVPGPGNGMVTVWHCTWVARCWTRRGADRWYRRNVLGR